MRTCLSCPRGTVPLICVFAVGIRGTYLCFSRAPRGDVLGARLRSSSGRCRCLGLHLFSISDQRGGLCPHTFRCISGRPPSYAAPSEAISAKGAFITKTHMYPVTCANLRINNNHAQPHNNGDPRPSHTGVARTRVVRRSRPQYRTRDLKIPSERS